MFGSMKIFFFMGDGYSGGTYVKMGLDLREVKKHLLGQRVCQVGSPTCI